MRSESKRCGIMPIDVLAEGRPCLVVGGGTIATRKVGLLLDAGARVEVISDTITDKLSGWLATKRIRHIPRRFRATDVKGRCLVFAATDNESVNRQVIAACRRARVWCNAIDANWAEGDFLTPATLRTPDLILTVATGGESCRRSRFVKDSLGRHAEWLVPRDLLVITGAACTAHQLAALHGLRGVHDLVPVRTARGNELLAVVSPDRTTRRLLTTVIGTQPRFLRGPAAFAHVVRQMAAHPRQVTRYRQALTRAGQRHWAGPFPGLWLAEAYHCAVTISQPAVPDGRTTAVSSAAFRQPALIKKQKESYERLIRSFKSRHANQ